MENLKSYLDGELDLAQQAEVETHLRNDADLQQMVEDFRSIAATLKTADAGEPYGAEALEKRLTQTGSDQAASNKKIWRTALYWSAGAACLAVLGMMLTPVFAQSKMAAKKSMFAMGRSSSDAAADKATLKDTLQFRPQVTYKTQDQAGAATSDQTKSEATGEARQAPVDGGQPGGEGSAQFGISQGDLKSLATGEPDAYPAPGATTTKGLPERTENNFAQAKDGGGGAHFGDATERTRRTAASAAAPETAKKFEEPESKFKSDMRSIRDQQQRSPTNLNDTPHGIYLERSGQIQVKVDDLMRAVDEATGMVQGLDGFVMNHDLQNEEDGGSATMSLKVPTKNYNAAMNKLQGMGEVISVNSASQDITTETVDNGARMISWADEEKRLMGELAKAKTNDEKWRIRSQLSSVRANLESYRATVKSLKERAEYSTINVSFVRGDKAEKAGGSSNWSGNAFKEAKNGLGSVGQVLGVICIYTLVFSPIWLPFVIAAFIIKKKNS